MSDWESPCDDAMAHALASMVMSDDPGDQRRAALMLLGVAREAMARGEPLSKALKACDRYWRHPGRHARSYAVCVAYDLVREREPALSEAAFAGRIDGWPEHGEVEPPELQELLAEALAAGAEFPVSYRTVQSILAAHRQQPRLEQQEIL